MAIARYLAMTEAEFRENPAVSQPIAWMSCRFSPEGTGLVNIPPWLPEGAVLMVDDAFPLKGHDGREILQTLSCCAETFRLSGILLDFQREGQEETARLARFLTEHLPCPVCVSERYAASLNCPVLLPPILPSQTVKEALSSWTGREIWLELSSQGEKITLTEQGTSGEELPQLPETGFSSEKLICHYGLSMLSDRAEFSLWRTAQDLENLLNQAAELGVTRCFGLYQEFSWARD